MSGNRCQLRGSCRDVPRRASPPWYCAASRRRASPMLGTGAAPTRPPERPQILFVVACPRPSLWRARLACATPSARLLHGDRGLRTGTELLGGADRDVAEQ